MSLMAQLLDILACNIAISAKYQAGAVKTPMANPTAKAPITWIFYAVACKTLMIYSLSACVFACSCN